MRSAQREVFLRELATHGVVRRAAQTASPDCKTPRGAAIAFYRLRESDPEFAAQWDEATEEAGAEIEAEIHRRGVSGFEEERVSSDGKVTRLRRYSDPCLLALARARLPAFRKSDVELSGRLEQVSKEEAQLAAEVRKQANKLAGDAKRPTVEQLAAAITKKAAEGADDFAARLAEVAEGAVDDA